MRVTERASKWMHAVPHRAYWHGNITQNPYGAGLKVLFSRLDPVVQFQRAVQCLQPPAGPELPGLYPTGGGLLQDRLAAEQR